MLIKKKVYFCNSNNNLKQNKMETIFIELEKYEDTIVEVDYIFREADTRVYYNSDMSGDDGQDAHISIFSVRIDDVCILNVMSDKAIEDLEERITKTLEK